MARSALTQLRDGRYFDLLNPDHTLIDFSDVCQTLDRICRFNGRTVRHYSVAEHSVRVGYLGSLFVGNREFVRACYAHDLGEAFTGDIIQPVKAALNGAMKPIEEGIDRAVCRALGLDYRMLVGPWVKRMDLLCLEWERRNVIEPLGVVPTPPEWPQPNPEDLPMLELMDRQFPVGLRIDWAQSLLTNL